MPLSAAAVVDLDRSGYRHSGGIPRRSLSGRVWWKDICDAVRYTADLLNGVPSIVIGIFAWTVIVVPSHHFSAWAGGFALSLMMIPIGLRATEQFLRSVPNSLREGSLALGASKTRTILSVIVPAAKQGILTGMILGVARVAGETAPLLFTSFNNQFWANKLGEPMASLARHDLHACHLGV